jgi:hypothetical protein
MVKAQNLITADSFKCVMFTKNVVKPLITFVVQWSEFLATDPDFLRSSGSGTGSTQPHEYN